MGCVNTVYRLPLSTGTKFTPLRDRVKLQADFAKVSCLKGTGVQLPEADSIAVVETDLSSLAPIYLPYALLCSNLVHYTAATESRTRKRPFIWLCYH